MFWQGFIKRAQWAKRKYKTYDVNRLDPNKDDTWTSKIDGAHTVIKMEEGKIPELFSHRISKRTGGAIPYNEKLQHIKTPSEVNALLRGETYAVDKNGRAVEPEIVAALLNSKPANSLALQKRLGITTRTALIDIDKLNGKDMSNEVFHVKRQILEDIVDKHPEFELPEMAITPQEKKRLLAEIKSGRHPQTREGIIVHSGENFGKAKFSNPHDVYVHSIFKEESKRGLAGGITYSWTPDGEPKGNVGTGFTHATKKDMLKHPKKYIGRVAMVQSLGVSKNNILLKPSFKGWHVEKNLE